MIIDKDGDDENWANYGAPSGGKSLGGDCNDNDNNEGVEDAEHSQNNT